MRKDKTGLAFLWDMRQRIDRPPDTVSLRGPGDGQFRSYEKKNLFFWSNRVIKGLHNVVNATRYTLYSLGDKNSSTHFRIPIQSFCVLYNMWLVCDFLIFIRAFKSMQGIIGIVVVDTKSKIWLNI